ncbi:hypothetical protein PVAG01_03136 [Phlyctema vagabunda]|uniref:F-box domain-containing protein n=1 Tax=Phlyctema vagabunda TaxID=108571 RepID=A0ABR4PSN4_9HELO
MACITDFPAELLRMIMRQQSLGKADLFNCTLVCKFFEDVAYRELYGVVDFAIDRAEDCVIVESKERQLSFLRSVAKNPKLGAAAMIFKDIPNVFGRNQDPIWNADPDMLFSVAENMKNISEASLAPTATGSEIVSRLPDYQRLFSLSVKGLDPRQHIWDVTPVNLTYLEWKVPRSFLYDGPSPRDFLRFLIDVVETTCPALESLKILMCGSSRDSHSPGIGQPERSEKHFGFEEWYPEINTDKLFLDFLKKHRQSLKSVYIPIFSEWTREQLRFVLEACSSLPGLPQLEFRTERSGRPAVEISTFEALSTITRTLASPEFSIESFNFDNTGSPFSARIARLFQRFKSLKFLRLGDEHWFERPHIVNGKVDFNRYRPEFLAFIEGLPTSLEELYLDINRGLLILDEDEVFDPFRDLEREIFSVLRRLRTCDIHARSSYYYDAIGLIPQHSVFFRRLFNDYGFADDKEDFSLLKKTRNV